MAPQEDDDKSDSLEGGKDDDEDSDKRGVQLPSSASVHRPSHSNTLPRANAGTAISKQVLSKSWI